MKPYANNPHHSVITLISHIITLAILMIISGCNINAKIDDKGNTKLHEMAYKCNLEEVNKLIAAGANINAKNNDGFTPLFNAVGCSSTNITKKLIDSGADVNAKNNDGFTPLFKAVVLAAGNRLPLDHVKLLLEAAADVNDCYGGESALSSLMVAMDPIKDENINACLETAKLLVAYGATGDEEATKKLKQLEEEAAKKHQAKEECLAECGLAQINEAIGACIDLSPLSIEKECKYSNNVNQCFKAKCPHSRNMDECFDELYKPYDNCITNMKKIYYDPKKCEAACK